MARDQEMIRNQPVNYRQFLGFVPPDLDAPFLYNGRSVFPYNVKNKINKIKISLVPFKEEKKS
jgi:hypothetical protein